MQINVNKVLDIYLKVWYKGANANDSHYHLEGYRALPSFITHSRWGSMVLWWYSVWSAVAFVWGSLVGFSGDFFLRVVQKISLDRWKSYIPLRYILSYLFFKCQSVGFGGRLCQFSSVFTRGIDVGNPLITHCTFLWELFSQSRFLLHLD